METEWYAEPRSKDAALHLDLIALLAKATYRASDSRISVTEGCFPVIGNVVRVVSWCLGPYHLGKQRATGNLLYMHKLDQQKVRILEKGI